MKIRTITTGIALEYPIAAKPLARLAAFSHRARQAFIDRGYQVQTLRLASQPWPGYLGELGLRQLIATVIDIEAHCVDQNIDFFSIGTAFKPRHTQVVPRLIESTSRVAASATIADQRGAADPGAIRAAARAITAIARTTDRGYGNFRFAAIANCPPGIPFFPASYHRGPTCFSIGVEAADLVFTAFRSSNGLDDARRNLRRLLQREYGRVEALAREIERREKIRYAGLDASPAPSLHREGSIALAVEQLSGAVFGGPGSLAVAGLITEVLKSLKIRLCGYSGLMLPVLEDVGLVRAVSRGTLRINDLLALSAVCGTGLDCIPLPGDIAPEAISMILADVAALAVRLAKPLSARLLPVPGKRPGQKTAFKSPYLCDGPVMDPA